MVPWLGFGTFTAVAQVQSLVGEMRSQQPHSVDKEKKNAKKGLVDNVIITRSHLSSGLAIF